MVEHCLLIYSTMSLLILLCVCVSGALACDPRSLNSCLFSGDFDFFDLTHPFTRDTIYWPNSRRFQLIKAEVGFRNDGSWYAANEFCAGEHGGTHLDAPYHFSRNGSKVADIPLHNLILPLYIVDVSSQVSDDPGFVLRKPHLDHMLNVFHVTSPGLVVFKFGWTKFYSSPGRYLGLQADNNTLSFPGLSKEVAEFIVSSYPNVVGVGVDTASVDPGSSQQFDAHKTLMRAGLYVLENVKLDVSLPDIKCTALVLPMKIGLGTGAPLRLAALCPRDAARPFSAKDFS